MKRKYLLMKEWIGDILYRVGLIEGLIVDYKEGEIYRVSWIRKRTKTWELFNKNGEN
jgi:hypothetical protein